jgi:general secretion pathway protein J
MRSRENGFTLLEVIVALAVLGLLLVTLTQGVHFGFLASRTQARIAAGNADLNEIDLTLRRLIGAMDPGTDDEDAPPLLAGRDSMTFVTILPGAAEMHRVEATLLVDTRHRLVLRWRPRSAMGRTDQPPAWQETPLLQGVAGMRLAFWRRSGGWADGWQSGDLPGMVRIRLSFEDRVARHWPDIVVAPRLDRP